MQPIKLEDIVPSGSTFTLKKTGKTYRLKPVSLEDEKWLAREYGAGLDKVFREIEMTEVCRIAFHQMEEEDKADFAKQTVKIMNDEGDYVTGEVGGSALLAAMVVGHQEKMDLFHALLETIGVSRPVIDRLVDEEKKTFESAQKQTGPKSSMSLVQNTDGQASTSSAGRPGKSHTGSKRSAGAGRSGQSSTQKSTTRRSAGG